MAPAEPQRLRRVICGNSQQNSSNPEKFAGVSRQGPSVKRPLLMLRLTLFRAGHPRRDGIGIEFAL
jgi:hypothetical protein